MNKNLRKVKPLTTYKTGTMKSMTCEQLGGACSQEFTAATFEEIAEMSKTHGMKMIQQGDEAHIQAMNRMQDLMGSPEKMTQWFEEKREEFNQLPQDTQQ